MIRSLVLLAWLAPTVPDPDPDPLALGSTAFGEQRYDDAATHFAAAFDRYGRTDILYDWAQAARLAGHCDDAIDVYRRFVDRWEPNPPEGLGVSPRRWAAQRTNAERQRAHCLQQLETEPPEPPVAEPDPPIDSAPVEPEPDPQPAEPDPPTTDPIDRGPIDDPSPRSWRRDPTGITLLSLGSAATAAGIALVVSAELTRRTAEDADVHQDQRDGLTRAGRLQTAGFVVLPVGVALAVGGAIRLGVLARRQRRVAVTLDPFRPGLTVRGRFSLRPFVLR